MPTWEDVPKGLEYALPILFGFTMGFIVSSRISYLNNLSLLVPDELKVGIGVLDRRPFVLFFSILSCIS